MTRKQSNTLQMRKESPSDVLFSVVEFSTVMALGVSIYVPCTDSQGQLEPAAPVKKGVRHSYWRCLLTGPAGECWTLKGLHYKLERKQGTKL